MILLLNSAQFNFPQPLLFNYTSLIADWHRAVCGNKMFILLKPLSQGLVSCFSLPCTLFKGWIFPPPMFFTVKDSHVSKKQRERDLKCFGIKPEFASSRLLTFNTEPKLWETLCRNTQRWFVCENNHIQNSQPHKMQLKNNNGGFQTNIRKPKKAMCCVSAFLVFLRSRLLFSWF